MLYGARLRSSDGDGELPSRYLTPKEFKTQYTQRTSPEFSTPLIPAFDTTAALKPPAAKAGAASKAPSDLGSTPDLVVINPTQPVSTK
jgi:hypothetical protein